MFQDVLLKKDRRQCRRRLGVVMGFDGGIRFSFTLNHLKRAAEILQLRDARGVRITAEKLKLVMRLVS